MSLLKIIRLFTGRIRSFFCNFLIFHSWKHHCSFGKNVSIVGNVKCGNYVVFGDNVEIRNLTKEQSLIGNYTSVNRNSTLRGVYRIGNHCAIAPNCSIIGVNHGFADIEIPIKRQALFSKGGITIEDDVWIGANSVILDGVTIGRGCVIGAGSVVTKSIPPYSVAVGNPCKVIKSRK